MEYNPIQSQTKAAEDATESATSAIHESAPNGTDGALNTVMAAAVDNVEDDTHDAVEDVQDEIDDTRDAGEGADLGSFATVMRALKSFVSKLYLDPLNPNNDMVVADRTRLAWESARPWSEFFNITKYNLPPSNQVSTRMLYNAETYLYNYIFLILLHLVLSVFFQFSAVLSVSLWIGVMVFLFIVKKTDITITSSVVIDSSVKVAIAVAVGIIVLFFGGGMDLLISSLLFIVLIIGVHAAVRDDADEEMV